MCGITDAQHSESVPTPQSVNAHIEMLDVIHRSDFGYVCCDIGYQVSDLGPKRLDVRRPNRVISSLGADEGDLQIAPTRYRYGDSAVLRARKERLPDVRGGRHLEPPHIEANRYFCDWQIEGPPDSRSAAVTGHSQIGKQPTAPTRRGILNFYDSGSVMDDACHLVLGQQRE